MARTRGAGAGDRSIDVLPDDDPEPDLQLSTVDDEYAALTRDAPEPPVRRQARQRTQTAAEGLLRTGRPAAHRLLRNRRQVLLALGAGTVGLGGVGSVTAAFGGHGTAARTVAAGHGSPKDAGAFADRDSSFVHGLNDTSDLGAAGLADTPSQAAAAALRATPKQPTPLSRDPVLHLLRRTTFGPTDNDIATVRQIGIDAWIDRQLAPANLPDALADQALAVFPTVNLTIAQLRGMKQDNGFDPMQELGRATIARQMWSSRQLFEVMAEFWSNHLNVVNPLDGGEDNRGPYDRDVIRKYALGRYEDMLLASARHPAMLRYLNNADSDRRNVNENYGREILELHTVGIDSGYTEKDVRNSAYIMTGRTIDDKTGQFVYQSRRHWIGAVKVLGFGDANKSASAGLGMGDAYVKYLANHPATATVLARKLAVRFVNDSPPAGLVQRLAKTYLDNGTAIVPMLRVLFRSLEFWIATGLKTRRPLENVVATARVLGVAPGPKTADAMDSLYNLSRDLGNAPMNWAAPNGYPDVAAAWTSANGMLTTWNSHRGLVTGQHRGLAYLKPEQLVANRPPMVGAFVDALAARLVFQPLSANERQALLRFLGANDATKVKDATLGGKLAGLAPLVLDSIYHTLR